MDELETEAFQEWWKNNYRDGLTGLEAIQSAWVAACAWQRKQQHARVEARLDQIEEGIAWLVRRSR